MSHPIVPVILCGGAGTRLWPASNDAAPKPFLPLVDGTSTFSGTLSRVADRTLFAPPIIIANRDHRYLLAEAAAGSGATILLEPEPRDTAAAVAAAAEYARSQDPEAVILVLAADHLVRDAAGFSATMVTARPAAEAGYIVVFGVRPTGPSTSYGYIRKGTGIDGLAGVETVAAFVEKPNAEKARDYVAGGYLWNSGNFMMRAATALSEIEANRPTVANAAVAAVAEAKAAGGVVELAPGPFGKADRISFDHAVMEKTVKAAVVEARFDWTDLGTWASVWDSSTRDADGNAASGEVVSVDSHRNYITTDRPLIGVVGVDDLVVVAADDAVLVAPRARSDEVKKLVVALGDISKKVLGGHARHYRPWGYYQSLDVGETHQVKRIVVKPGGRLSLQKHQHRAEHWTVVRGVAEVTVDADIRILQENQSVFIPKGAVHRMANPGKIPMTLIEVQYGTYLGEDDIIRIEDDYGRTPA